LDAFQHEIARRGLRIEDVAIELDSRSGARFVFREGWILLIGGPVALWGMINHWLPFWAARAIAVRPGSDNADPAMRTVVGGAAFVLITYVAQSLLVDSLWGWRVALIYLASLPIAADINFWIRERLSRARRRSRAFRLFRRDPALRTRLVDELTWLRGEVLAVDRALGDNENGGAAGALTASA
jgi:hypothetical protein